MQCPNCGASMPEGFSFCTECGTTIDTQPAYEPEFTNFEDPAYTEEAKACIKKAKVALPMGIVALAAPFSGFILNIIAWLLNFFTLGFASIIIGPLQFLLSLVTPVGGIVCMILGFVFSSKPIKSDIQPETIAAELYEKYLSAKKKAKISKILCIIALVITIISIAVAVLAVIGIIAVIVISVFFPALIAGVPFLSELTDLLDIGAMF